MFCGICLTRLADRFCINKIVSKIATPLTKKYTSGKGAGFFIELSVSWFRKSNLRLMKKAIIFSLAIFISINSWCQDQLYRLNVVDILHYQFSVALEDTTDQITGQTVVTAKFLKDTEQFELDLKEKSGDGTGMTVHRIELEGLELSYAHSNDKLHINYDWKSNITYTISIRYSGVPADGLVIGQNKHGNRTFFADHWPDRAHNWLPCIDHPSDKATSEFIVEAPLQYEVIATGQKIEETTLRPGKKLTHYRCDNPMPMKVTVIGVAEFAMQYAGNAYGYPVTSWVYPEDRSNGFKEYHPAVEILKYFIDKIGPYPNSKLANVQSKTRFGGMENAGNIFYFEGSVNGKMDDTNLLAHEIAHQWFGNSASELNWHHVWLSEGFATYLTNTFIEDNLGIDSLNHTLKLQREQIIKFFEKVPTPVIDTTITNYLRILSPNPYQKGAWFLHMLRRKVGDEPFWQGVKKYYNTYKYSNALSEDFKRIMESVSGMNLSKFFRQWLYEPGHPVLKISQTQVKKKLQLTIEQAQPQFVFEFPLEVSFVDAKGRPQQKTIQVGNKSVQSIMKAKGPITDFKIDPNTNILFELAQN